MPSWTVISLLKPRFLSATLCIMGFPCIPPFHTRARIHIDTTELLATFPAPGAATPRTHIKPIRSCLKPACEYIVARGIFETPACAPRTLFGVHDYALVTGFVHPFINGCAIKSGFSCTSSSPFLNTNRYPKSSTRLRIVERV